MDSGAYNVPTHVVVTIRTLLNVMLQLVVCVRLVSQEAHAQMTWMNVPPALIRALLILPVQIHSEAMNVFVTPASQRIAMTYVKVWTFSLIQIINSFAV